MKLFELRKQLSKGLHSFEIKDNKTGKTLLLEQHECNGIVVRREDLTRYPHRSLLYVDGNLEGTIIECFKERSE